MKMIIKIWFFSLLVVAALFVQNASAVLMEYLPESSYAGDTWQGYKYYDEDLGDSSYLRGRIDFAVYDTGNLQFPDEADWVSGLAVPGEGQYIYAYQIFNDYPLSDEAVAYFAVFGVDSTPLDLDEASIGSHEDPGAGIEPSDGYLSADGLKVVWEFGDSAGFSFIYKDDHSWFLVFRSNSGPVKGDFEITAPTGQGELPIPEPATIALLSIGSALFLRRRKAV